MSTPGQCTACGIQLLDDSSFCHGCGRPVAAAPAGEHKPITVLFIDAFGSIGLGDRLDAEQWHDVMESFFSAVSTTVQHYGGAIDRLTGEGIKVLFGAPIALESHATQACHAALRLRERLDEFAAAFRVRAGVEFDVRMGIGSGKAVFGPVDGTAGFTSQGHVAALAARMQQLAEPGCIYVTEDTAALVADYFELRELGDMEVRNANRRVRTFELLAAREDRTRLDAARERGLSPLLGREHELAELDDSMRAASRDGLRIVGVVGEPGIGKSRLVEEFAERQRARGVRVHVTHCAEHSRWIPFHTTVPFLRTFLGVTPTDDLETARARITERLRALDAGLLDTLPVLLAAFGFANVDEVMRAVGGSSPARDLARVLRAIVSASGILQPSIFVVDDQQWMDPGASALFDEMVRNPPSAPALVVVTYRRGHDRPWMHDAHFRRLALRPLDDATTLQLVRAIIGDDRSLHPLQKRIVERAAGNPFFVEETIRALAATGAIDGSPGDYRLRDPSADVAVPASLHAVLASRIDRLTEREKTVLQAAAVAGRDFAAPLLATLTGLDDAALASVLQKLEEEDFVEVTGWGSETVCRFRHPLLQQTAYASLLRDHRARLHRVIATELARGHGTRDNPLAARIARHEEAAGDDLEAARWHRRAAYLAFRWDPAQSFAHWRRAHACTGRVSGADGTRLRLVACEAIVRLGHHQGLDPDEAGALVREGLQIARALGDDRTHAMLLSAGGTLLCSRGALEEGLAQHREATHRAERLRDAGLTLKVSAQMLLASRIAGRLDEGIRFADDVLAHWRPENVTALGESVAWLRQLELGRAMLLLDRGRLDEGATELTRIIRAVRGEDSPALLAWALSLTATVVRCTGDATPILAARIEEAHGRSLRVGVPSFIARALCALAVLRLCQDRWQDARDIAEEACATMRTMGHTFYVDFDAQLVLSHARFGCGDIAGARSAAYAALDQAFRSGSRLGQIDAMVALGRLLVRYGTLEEIQQGGQMLRHGLALTRQCRARSREPFFWFELAGLARRGGNDRRALARQRRGVRLFVAMNAYGHVPRMPGLMTTPPERAHLRDELP